MSKKEQSNNTTAPVRGFKLPKSRLLKGKRNFEQLFSNSQHLSSSSVNLRYSAEQVSNSNFKVGFIAPKRTGNAVQRNHCKRLMREAFRLHQHSLLDLVTQANLEIHCAFIARSSPLNFQQVQHDVATLMEKLGTRLQIFDN